MSLVIDRARTTRRHDVVVALVDEAGQAPDYRLLFDENYQPKPAYWGVMDALLGR